MIVKIKTFNKECMPTILKKGDWIDLRAAGDVIIKGPSLNSNGNLKINYTCIPLGVAMELPKGFEAQVAPRSSTFKSFGLLQYNSPGIIDNCYNGDNDEWKFPAIAFRDTTIKKGERICQFRIQLSQKATIWQKIKWLFSKSVKLKMVYELNNVDRNGFGSTGKR